MDSRNDEVQGWGLNWEKLQSQIIQQSLMAIHDPVAPFELEWLRLIHWLVLPVALVEVLASVVSADCAEDQNHREDFHILINDTCTCMWAGESIMSGRHERSLWGAWRVWCVSDVRSACVSRVVCVCVCHHSVCGATCTCTRITPLTVSAFSVPSTRKQELRLKTQEESQS